MQAFPQNVIALVWDFDKTLAPAYMQTPLFRKFGVDQDRFWKEVNKLEEFYQRQGVTRVSRDTLYLTHILTYVRRGVFAGLTNDMLRELGAEIDLFPGLPDFFPAVKKVVQADSRLQRAQVEVEHYIVSTGLRQMILGNPIASHVDDIWACEFIEEWAPPRYLDSKPEEQDAIEQMQLLEMPSPPRSAKPIRDIGYHIDNTTKTRAIFELNKGVNKYHELDVNMTMAPEERRIPIENMIYVADGPSDVPVYSILNKSGGRTFAVYDKDSQKSFSVAKELQDTQRVQAFGPADYSPDSHTARWLMHSVLEIADRIASRFDAALRAHHQAPTHFTEPLPAPSNGTIV